MTHQIDVKEAVYAVFFSNNSIGIKNENPSNSFLFIALLIK